jgi:hypothetical protein
VLSPSWAVVMLWTRRADGSPLMVAVVCPRPAGRRIAAEKMGALGGCTARSPGAEIGAWHMRQPLFEQPTAAGPLALLPTWTHGFGHVSATKVAREGTAPLASLWHSKHPPLGHPAAPGPLATGPATWDQPAGQVSMRKLACAGTGV